jgi:hypothetical protein
MQDETKEKGIRAKVKFVESIGENSETIRKGLSDKRLQDAFIEAIDDDPQLVEVLAKVTPRLENVAADWSCCRGNRPGRDLEEIAQFLKNRIQLPKESGGG